MAPWLRVLTERESARGRIMYARGSKTEQRKRTRKGSTGTDKTFIVCWGEQSAAINAHAPTNWNRGHTNESLEIRLSRLVSEILRISKKLERL